MFAHSHSRQDVGFLEEQCKSPQARFVVFNDALNPLVKRESSNGPFDNVKDLVKHKVEGEIPYWEVIEDMLMAC